MAKRNIKALTGLRGVAALWVAAYHLLLPAGLVGGVAAHILGRGYLAVDLFFILSGFVLALNYGDRFGGPFRLPAFADFLWRRWGRIFPLYGAILGVRLLYTAVRYGRFDLPRPWIAVPLTHPWTEIPANLLLVQSWGISPSVIGPAWSVSAEWAAYWLFPVLALVLLHRGRRLAFAAAGAAACAVMGAWLLDGSLDCWNGQTAAPVLRCIGGFGLGMGVWRVSRWGPAVRVAATPEAGWLVAGAFAVGLAAGLPDLVVYPLLPAIILCLACGRGGVFGAGVPMWLGEISYALYLLHIFLLHPLDQARAMAALVLPAAMADPVAALLLAAVLIAAADLAHRLVERPGRAWIGRATYSLFRTQTRGAKYRMNGYHSAVLREPVETS